MRSPRHVLNKINGAAVDCGQMCEGEGDVWPIRAVLYTD